MPDNPPVQRTTHQPTSAPANDAGLAEARVRFLTSTSLDLRESGELHDVREAILTSWWRSARSQVPADRIEVPYYSQELNSTWVESSQPLLSRISEQLDGQPISLILTDPNGVVISQHTGDPDLQRHLERVHLLPGFSYGEQFVGTNGIGTALEDGRSSYVFGHEHYAEHLERLACAGVPIQHPISGKTIGAVDLTCWHKDAGGLLITLARSTAEQIRQALLTNTNVRELELFRAYLRTCRRTGGIVMALNADLVMMNDNARQLLDPADQTVLVGQATQALVDEKRTSITVDLPSGARARMHCRRVGGSVRSGFAGDVLHVELIEEDEPSPRGGSQRLPAFVPGMVGSAPLWLRSCHEADASYNVGEWLALVGEPGVGKYTMAECVHRRHNPQRRLRMFDAAHAADPGWLDDVAGELDRDPTGAIVIRHVDRLDTATANELANTLDGFRGTGDENSLWLAVTLAPGSETRAAMAELMSCVPRTVRVPPLRYHIEDIRELVPLILGKLSHGGYLSCSPGAMKLLMRATWPGNVAQLYQVLKHIAQHRRRTGAIQPEDLPAEYHAINRRSLNQLESIERDAIVDSLRDADGNKVRAAKSLGMSRATIYRKIRDYGIVAPNRSN